MCIAIVKPAGVAMPTEETLRQCWNHNGDGFGVSWAQNRKVHWIKGIAKYDDVAVTLDKVKSAMGVELENIALFMHFRIGTHGSKNDPKHTHPFPVCDSYEAMEQLEGEDHYVTMHNGIFNLPGQSASKSYTYGTWNATTKKYEHDKPQPSDTMEFAKEYLWPLCQVGSLVTSKPIREIIIRLTTGNRVATMDGYGRQAIFGQWIATKDGVFYSNDGYKVVKVVPKTYVNTGASDYWTRRNKAYDYDGTEPYYFKKYCRKVGTGVRWLEVVDGATTRRIDFEKDKTINTYDYHFDSAMLWLFRWDYTVKDWLYTGTLIDWDGKENKPKEVQIPFIPELT